LPDLPDAVSTRLTVDVIKCPKVLYVLSKLHYFDLLTAELVFKSSTPATNQSSGVWVFDALQLCCRASI